MAGPCCLIHFLDPGSGPSGSSSPATTRRQADPPGGGCNELIQNSPGTAFTVRRSLAATPPPAAGRCALNSRRHRETVSPGLHGNLRHARRTCVIAKSCAALTPSCNSATSGSSGLLPRTTQVPGWPHVSTSSTRPPVRPPPAWLDGNQRTSTPWPSRGHPHADPHDHDEVPHHLSLPRLEWDGASVPGHGAMIDATADRARRVAQELITD
jgi:hypothetical protein